MSLTPLTSRDYEGPTVEVARGLLGKTLTRKFGQEYLRSIIVEVEAYLSSNDAASHSHRGMKTGNRSMFLPRGHLYVYPIHSRHCMNVVTEEEGRGAAVLIRAAEPMSSVDTMWRQRFGSPPPETYSVQDLRSISQGPGRLCESLRVDRALDGVELWRHSEIWLEPPHPIVDSQRWKTRSSRRIGITKAQSRQLRFFIDGHTLVSGLARDHSKGRTWKFLDTPSR